MSDKEKNERLSLALRKNLKKRKIFQKKNKFRIKMPIVDVLYQIIYLNKNPKKCFLNFLNESGNIDT